MSTASGPAPGTDLVADAPDDDAHLDDVQGEGARQEATHRYLRSPLDLIRLLGFIALAAVVALVTALGERSVLHLEQNIIALFSFVTPPVERFLHGFVEVVALVAVLTAYAVGISARRWRAVGYILAANAVAALALAGLDAAIDRGSDVTLTNELAERAGLTDATASGPEGLAQLIAAFIAIGPFVSRRWRRAGAITVTVLAVMRLLVTVTLPADLFLALPVGAAAGCAVLLLFGRPDRRPTGTAIRLALGDAGLPVEALHPAAVDARGSTPWFATTDEGTGLFAKVLGAEERAADLLFRGYRFLRFKDVGDDRPFSSLRRTVEHEALVALIARDVGIRTPRMRGVVSVGEDSMLLAYDLIDGTSLDGVAPERVTDQLLSEIWAQVAVLRTHRIAHRDLRRANIFVDRDDRPWLIDFGFSEVAVDDALLDADVAQLLVSVAVLVGADRAVDTAVSTLGTEAVGAALPRLQLRALSGATQEAMKDQKGLLDELRDRVMARCGVDAVEYVQLERINRKTIFTLALLAAVTYFLVPQFADLPGIVDEVDGADWSWLAPMLFASAATYGAATVSLIGAVPDRLRALPLAIAQVASSFASKLAPAGLGGMALNVRMLQKQGVDQPVAVSAVGLNAVAGFAGHLTMIAVFIVWAGRDAFGSFELPDPKVFLIGLGVTLALIAIGMAVGPVRRVVLERLVPVLTRSMGGIRAVLSKPSKLLLLVGGSALVTFSYLLTLYLATQAFGGGLAFATVGAVFLVGSAVASAAPTPGGLGAVEAALISGLVAAGLDNTVAVPAVFLYRLFTFWLPILPGWLCFTYLRRNDYV